MNKKAQTHGAFCDARKFMYYSQTGLPEDLTSIGDSAFAYCSSLKSITLPKNVTSIGYGTFEYCSSLKSISLPEKVTSIEYLAFNECSRLTSIGIPAWILRFHAQLK